MAPRPIATTLAAALLLLGTPNAGRAQDELRWRPPITPVTVVRRFDPPVQRWLPGHRGVDLRATQGTTGARRWGWSRRIRREHSQGAA